MYQRTAAAAAALTPLNHNQGNALPGRHAGCLVLLQGGDGCRAHLVFLHLPQPQPPVLPPPHAVCLTLLCHCQAEGRGREKGYRLCMATVMKM